MAKDTDHTEGIRSMRLIDADALITQIETNICKPCRERKDDCHGVRCRACQYGDEINDIDSAPTVEQRKAGQWIDGKRMKFDGTFYWFRQCNQCGYERNDCDTEKDSNFCPDCGADMRGEQHETD